MTPEQFMSHLTDVVFVNHFDRDTWKSPCDTQVVANDVMNAVQTMMAQDKHPAGAGFGER